jgi:hypothetical protein
MKDMQAHLDKLRTQMAECELVRDRATDTQKRELFAEVAEHLKMLAAQIDHAMVKGGAGDTFLGRKTYEPFPKEKQ